MTVTLVIPHTLSNQIDTAAADDLETAGVLIAMMVRLEGSGDIRLLAREIVWVAQDHYQDRTGHGMVIDSGGYVPALAQAAEMGAVAIWLHTHPGIAGRPTPSAKDVEVDEAIADLFRIRADTPWYGTLIVSPRPSGMAFTGQILSQDGIVLYIDRVWQVGNRWRMLRSFLSPTPNLDAAFDRNVRAFGPDIQTLLGELHVAVVGSGGTGSAVAEQLVRLGVRNLTLFDVDTLSASNVTRVYGSSMADVGRPKVEVLHDHLARIAPDLRCEAVQGMITTESDALRLAACDLVFGCTDDNAGRLVLSRLATYMIVPVIDMGVLISSDISGHLVGIDGRVTLLSPGAACLVCRDRINLARAGVELMTPGERRRLQDEGYAPALAGVEPAVVTFTTAVAAAAVMEMLERMIGYGPDPRPSEVLLRWHEREISVNVRAPRPGHYCDEQAGKLGSGITRPFLEQTWPA